MATLIHMKFGKSLENKKDYLVQGLSQSQIQAGMKLDKDEETEIEFNEEVEIKKLDEETTEVDEVETVRANYKESFGKDVPTNKKNDIEWMLAKIEKSKEV